MRRAVLPDGSQHKSQVVGTEGSPFLASPSTVVAAASPSPAGVASSAAPPRVVPAAAAMSRGSFSGLTKLTVISSGPAGELYVQKGLPRFVHGIP